MERACNFGSTILGFDRDACVIPDTVHTGSPQYLSAEYWWLDPAGRQLARRGNSLVHRLRCGRSFERLFVLGAVLAVKKLVEFAKGIEKSEMVVGRRLRDSLGGSEGLGFDRPEKNFRALLFDAPPQLQSETFDSVVV
jgi:hypothetical protein